MVDQVGLSDAERALTEIERRRVQVIRQVIIPGWFWWGLGVQLDALTWAAESLHGLLLATVIATIVVGIVGVVGKVLLRLLRGAAPHKDLLDSKIVVPMLVGVMTFQVVVIGVSLAVLFSLKAAGVSHPATVTVAVTAVLLGIGGPMLMRHITRVLLARRSTGSDG